MTCCRLCRTNFIIEPTDLQFYEKISPTFDGTRFPVPPPALCPLCRAQQRYVWRGELHLFRRNSDFSGHPMITFYPPAAPCRVYSTDEWWSDKWDGLNYGRDFDFSRPFFEQFRELVESVPLLARSTVNNGDNCEYTNCASYCKNCYLIAGANYNEDCYYGNYVNNSKDCVDCSFVRDCELCYECVDCTGCYHVLYSRNSHSCSDSVFIANCRNCQHCFGCVNLVGKQFCFFNQQLSKDAYESRLAALNLHNRSSVDRLKIEFEGHRLTFPHRYMIGEMNDNVTGNAIHNSRDSFDCFDANELWDCKYCHWFNRAKNCMDIISWGFPAELCYQCMEAGDNAYHTMFSVSCYGARDVLYSYYGMYCKNCFGCVSLKKAEYCILNKQYSKLEYEQLVSQIIKHMQKTEEWGEFFPISLSPLSYNTSIAQDYFPLGREEVERLRGKWCDEIENVGVPGVRTAIPDSITEVADSLCSSILTCRVSGKPYKVIKQELEFYRRNRIPVPDVSFMERHKIRLGQRAPRFLWDRNCAKCQKALRTSFSPRHKEIIYCDECYLVAIY